MLGIWALYMILLVVLEKTKKHLSFQCEFNDNEILASYANGVYGYYDIEQIEEFVAFKGAYEVASLLEKYDGAPYKSENFAILKYCYENYDCNAHINDYIKRVSTAQEETNVLQESMEEEIAETESSLDEKVEEESEEESNSLTHTLFYFPSEDECYDPLDSFEISLFDELDVCYVYGHDAPMNDAYENERAIIPYVKNEVVAIASTLDTAFYGDTMSVGTIDDDFVMPTTYYNDHDWGDNYDASFDLENLFDPHNESIIHNKICKIIEMWVWKSVNFR